MATYIQYMSNEEVVLCLQTAKLEQQYERVLQQAERIYEEEKARALRVQLLLLEDENDTIRDQLCSNEDAMHKLEFNNEDLYDSLATIESDFQAAQIDLKTKSRDLERYKTEINALNAASTDTTSLLAEKLSLSRELAILKPELEHLKSQSSMQQNFLAEKLALERELSAANVELETEKRATQRIRQQDKTAGAGEATMIDEIDSLKKEITKEKRSIQKQEREHMKKATEWDTQKEAMETKLEAFRNKLRTTKEQLKEAQDELEKVQTAKFTEAAAATKARMNGDNTRKRTVARFDPDMTIGTPGNGGPAAKRQRISVLSGDKSAFSITPFLNKTLSILPESPSEEEAKQDDIDEQIRSGSQNTIEKVGEELPLIATKPNIKKAAAKKTLVSKTNEPVKEIANPKSTAFKKQALSKVTEEDEEDKHDQHQNTSEATKSITDISSTLDPAKKQKISALKRPTIFDDDEDFAPKRITKKLNLTGLRGGTNGISGLGKVALGGKNKVLAEFSPLKKDRRVAV